MQRRSGSSRLSWVLTGWALKQQQLRFNCTSRKSAGPESPKRVQKKTQQECELDTAHVRVGFTCVCSRVRVCKHARFLCKNWQ